VSNSPLIKSDICSLDPAIFAENVRVAEARNDFFNGLLTQQSLPVY